ncbi:DMT family transporter [Qipengyuania sp. YIM B01966]|uniref:DMT family transporter n=1 Tax=Qipengyuania sp. YIM B01966 TaxID=2778646 RepID=UPI0018F4ACDB|nr:SMR family transporter [Qipengyuania sp. YIM B01966]
MDGRATAWTILLIAGILEIVWAAAMKRSQGLTRVCPTAVMVAAMAASVLLLAWSMRVLPLGTDYMVWTGIGALGAFVVGILWFGECVSIVRLVAAALIIIGLALMKFATSV